MINSKEYWLVPKRTDLHQAIIFLLAIKEKYNGKSWNASAQDRIGSFIGKQGATNNGKTVTPQSIRTLLAGIPQFFGFVIKNEDTSPHTLNLTDAGKKILDETQNIINQYSYRNLRDGKKNNATVQITKTFLLQFIKLQLTNPNILPYCENILVFPLFCMIKILENCVYLTKEEIAYFIFKIKYHDEIDLKILEIQNFRKLNISDRETLINTFKNTELGNKSLVQAPTVSYFLSLCSYTELFEIKNDFIQLGNKNSKLVSQILTMYNDLKPFDFKKNKLLWENYFTNTFVKKTPIEILITNYHSSNIFVEFSNDNKIVENFVLETNKSNNTHKLYIIENLNNNLSVFCMDTYKEIYNDKIYTHNHKLDISTPATKKEIPLNYKDLSNLIIEHCKSKTFDNIFLKNLKFLEMKTKRDFINNKNLRGARLEELFFKMLTELYNKNLLPHEPIWYGKIGEYNLPTPAPGGKDGRGDIVIFIDTFQIIFELTTIKNKSGQEKSEAFSVPDHIKNHALDHPELTTIGIFIAPLLHSRVVTGMESIMKGSPQNLFCFELDEFLNNFLKNKSIDEFSNFFHSL